RMLVQQGLIRVELGERRPAAEALRAGVELLDPASEPDLVAANLYLLASLLRGLVLEAQAAGAVQGAAADGAGPSRRAGEGGHAGEGGGELSGASLGDRAPLPPAAQAGGEEALGLVERARALYRGLGAAAAEARLARLQGQI